MVDLDTLERLAKDAPAVLTLADSGQYGRLRAALDGDTVLSLVQAVRAALVVEEVVRGSSWCDGAAELTAALEPFRREAAPRDD